MEGVEEEGADFFVFEDRVGVGALLLGLREEDFAVVDEEADF